MGFRVVSRQAIRRTQADADAEAQLADTDYRDLQQRAKALGVPANQSADALREAIAAIPDGAAASEEDRA